MATSTLVPLSEYLRTSYRPDRDWIDGVVKERNVGEGSTCDGAGVLYRIVSRTARLMVCKSTAGAEGADFGESLPHS